MDSRHVDTETFVLNMEVRVSPELNAILDDATMVSLRRGKCWVGVEHLFEVLMEQNTRLPKVFMDVHHKSLTQAMQVVAQNGWAGDPPSPGEVFYTPRCAAVSSEAARLAEKLRSSKLDAGHLLLAILRDHDSAPSEALDRLKINRREIVLDLRNALQGERDPIENKAGAPQDRKPSSQEARKEKSQSARRIQSKDRAEHADDSDGSVLESLTTDLTAKAELGLIEPAIGRDTVLLQIMQVLSRKSKNNVILVGEAGVGKTKVIEGLAVAGINDQFGGLLSEKRILDLNVSALMSGTKFRGELEEKLLALLKEIKESPDTVLFIDEIHLIMGAGGTGEGGMDVANLMKPALARGEIRCLGATTFNEYRKFIEKDPAIERRFQMIRLEPLTDDATLNVLEKLAPSLSKHHTMGVDERAMKAAISLTNRYMPNRQQPDKAIDILDQACARLRLKIVASQEGWKFSTTGLPQEGESPTVTVHEIRRVISEQTGIPIEDLTAAERMHLENMGEALRQKIIGQDDAVQRVVAAVKKSRAGLADPNRPDATMLFLGPSGVGKTQLAKELSNLLFGSKDHLITFDMSEYIEEHSVSRLLGSPPGYKGSDEEGRLTGAVRNAPFSILLFDEIEKAHPRIFDIFLPVFEEGRLKDSKGRDVSFRNTIIILTSNVGADILLSDTFSEDQSPLFDRLQEHFRPEFINRIDEIVPFYPLMFEDIRSIVAIALAEIEVRLSDKNIKLHVYQDAYEHLAEKGYNPQFGARELRRTVDQLVAGPLSNLLIEGKFPNGCTVEVLLEKGKLQFRRGASVDRGTDA